MADIHYRRARFATRLPDDRLFTPSHFWLLEYQPGLWRVGFTKFAARMFGDVVDIAFDASPGTTVALGDAVGWFEGFKARSDLHTVVAGTFDRGNPDLDQDVDVIDRDRYGQGWLYEVRGAPDPAACDAPAYAAILDAAIDRRRGRVRQEQR